MKLSEKIECAVVDGGVISDEEAYRRNCCPSHPDIKLGWCRISARCREDAARVRAAARRDR